MASLPLLDRDALKAVADLLMRAELYPERRSLLLRDLSPQVRQRLPVGSNPADQLRLDLHHLNRLGADEAGSAPLIDVLTTAADLLKPRPEASEIAPYIARLTGERQSRADLEALEEELDALEARGAPPAEISAKWAEIRALKRAARQGEPLEAGQVIADRFALCHFLGSGGFGEVWAARDKTLGGRVALKIMHPHLTRDASRRERLIRGARAMRTLREIDHIVTVDEVLDAQGRVLIVMQLIKGTDLECPEHSAYPPNRAARLIRDIALAVGEAHQRGIVHRDIKPANILVDADGRGWLTDFDLVYLPHSTAATSSILGTVNFIAPEAMTVGTTAEPTVDVFALGMTLLHLLNGGALPNCLAAEARLALIEQLSLPPSLASILRRALESHPTRRYPDAAALAAALDGFLDDHAAQRPWRPAMATVPAGTFNMGDDSHADAAPLHIVELTEDLWMATGLVTQRQYNAVLDRDGSSHCAGDGPAIVSWLDAIEYCNQLSTRELLSPVYSTSGGSVWADWRADGYRLATEAEWERAVQQPSQNLSVPHLEIPSAVMEWTTDPYTELSADRATDPRPSGQPTAPANHPHDQRPDVPDRVVRGGRLGQWVRHRRDPDSRDAVGFRVVRRRPSALAQIPCSPDPRHFLVWQQRGGDYFTTWLTASRGHVEVEVHRWPELLLGFDRRLWRGETVPVSAWFATQLGPTFEPSYLRRQNAYRLVDPSSGHVLPKTASTWGALSEDRSATDGELRASCFEYRREDRVLGAIGCYCLYRTDELHYGGGSCGDPVVTFTIFDLRTGEATPLLDMGLGNIESDRALMQRAARDWLAASKSWEPSAEEAQRLSLTEIGFKFTDAGRLTLDCQLTGCAECHAATDGSAGCCLRSVRVETDYLPPLLQPFAEMPEPVRIWFERNPIGFLGWTALDDTDGIREALRALLGPPHV